MPNAPLPTSPSFTASDGAPFPPGALWLPDEQAFNFSIFSRNATAITLLLYRADDLATPCLRVPFRLPHNKTGDMWHARVPASHAGDACYYGYSVAGPCRPEDGLLFDAEKLLLDPYARGVFFPPGFDRAAACRPGPTAGRAPLGVLPGRADTPPPPIRRPRRHDHDLVIYELHVRAFTRDPSSGVPAAWRGSYAALTARIPYLKALGITAVELMPVFQRDPLHGTFWGYMPLNFFSPHAGYASDGTVDTALREFREMVAALHEAEIELFLDVVYNHTAEDHSGGPVWSYRGIDNASYYSSTPGTPFRATNRSGCGNDLDVAAPVVRQLILSSVWFWIAEMGIDGLRFDLASTFSVDETGHVDPTEPPIVTELSDTAHHWHTRLIAEPWAGDGSLMQLGRAFPGRTWRQWNARFRDDVRRFLRGDQGCVPLLMTRLYGSTDLFPDDRAHAARPYQSINYLASHDGLTLRDLFSYDDPGQFAANCGHQGAADAPEPVQALRRRQTRNGFCLLMLANGTPMFQAGDEFGHSRGGDPNPYDRDDTTNWLDWRLTENEAPLLRFVRMLVAFRAAHPSIARSVGWRDDVSWHGVDGGDPDLRPVSRSLAFFLRGATMEDDDLYVLINGWDDTLHFALPEAAQGAGTAWRGVIDTAAAPPADILPPEAALPVGDMERLTVQARAIRVLLRTRRDKTRQDNTR
ncbi:glycogen debranching protein [Gluconacetobacter sacchari]|uniref:Glycogen-debranching protein n=2 Tax=Gluconacetobacter sacchari TaxID=92759 RepID=A0A7W4NLC3_9PROT|nr:alpha-amylase family glycosyl hydrolase [Gluconacetobacter sacchari]MBB2159852.1 glycogen-debranching protein [Gluconacetobacter sacchari]